MSAELLRRAAAKLRETAAKATPGPWMTSRIAGIGSALHDSELHIHIPVGTTDVSAADGAWIALASPIIAEPLATYLENEATTADELTAIGLGPGEPYRLALTLARAVLGEP